MCSNGLVCNLPTLHHLVWLILILLKRLNGNGNPLKDFKKYLICSLDHNYTWIYLNCLKEHLKIQRGTKNIYKSESNIGGFTDKN